MLKIRSLNVCLLKQTALRILRAKISFNEILLLKERFEVKMQLLQESLQNI